MLPQPLKPRSPPGRSQNQAPSLLPRSHSYNALSRAVAPEGMLDGLLRMRVMRTVLLSLISLVLAANCVWAAQAVAAWRRGLGEQAGSQQQLLLQRLNSTTLSVEVSRVGEEGEFNTYLLNAQLVASTSHNEGNTGKAQQEDGAAAAVGADADATPRESEEQQVQQQQQQQQQRQQQQQQQQQRQQQQQQQQSGGSGLVAQLKGVGSALGLVAAKESSMSGRSIDDAGKAAGPVFVNSSLSSPPPPPQPRRAVLKMPEVEERSSDACAQALQLPKVALLFLTRGDLYHHESWRLWFEAARDLLPAEQLRAAACPAAAPPATEHLPRRREVVEQPDGTGPAQEPQQGQVQELTGLAAVAAACGWNASSAQQMPGSGGRGVLQQQHLFSVYVHAPPNVTDYQLPELFRGQLVPDRILPEWGTHQLVEATRNLLWEAFKDPLNQRFVLLSESDIPLYDPLTLHQQLLAEVKSRVNLCRHAAPTDTRRWSWRMSGPGLKSWHWRKSSQWFGMLRSHVHIVLEDVEVFRKFEEHCKNFWDGDYRRWRDCFSDEHYIPTLLATKDLDSESFCSIDGVVAADWSAGGPHPKTYKSWEVRPGLVQHARGTDRGCDSSAAIRDAQRRFVAKRTAFGPSSGSPMLCSGSLAAYEHVLPGKCSLTARKFPKPTVRAVHRLLTDCKNKLQLLGPAACRH